MQTIKTKRYTDTNGNSKISAASNMGAGRIRMNWSDLVPKKNLGQPVARHAIIAKLCAEKLGWKGKRVGGPLDRTGDVFIWVHTSEPSFTTKEKRI